MFNLVTLQDIEKKLDEEYEMFCKFWQSLWQNIYLTHIWSFIK